MSDLAVLGGKRPLTIVDDADVAVRGSAVTCCVERPMRSLFRRHREKYIDGSCNECFAIW